MFIYVFFVGLGLDVFWFVLGFVFGFVQTFRVLSGFILDWGSVFLGLQFRFHHGFLFCQTKKGARKTSGMKRKACTKPIGSMYGIYANIGGILMANVTPYMAYMDPMGNEISNINQNDKETNIQRHSKHKLAFGAESQGSEPKTGKHTK